MFCPGQGLGTAESKDKNCCGGNTSPSPLHNERIGIVRNDDDNFVILITN